MTSAAIVVSIANRPSTVSGTLPERYQCSSRARLVIQSNSSVPRAASAVNRGNSKRSIGPLTPSGLRPGLRAAYEAEGAVRKIGRGSRRGLERMKFGLLKLSVAVIGVTLLA